MYWLFVCHRAHVTAQTLLTPPSTVSLMLPSPQKYPYRKEARVTCGCAKASLHAVASMLQMHDMACTDSQTLLQWGAIPHAV